MGAARTILDSLAARAGEVVNAAAPTIIRRQLREQLEAKGYQVAEQVGQSGFKCSLAVKRHPEDGQYSLAILIDDEQHYANSNLIEQYYQRPAILRGFGWTVLPVYAKDWLNQPQKVMAQVWRALGVAGVEEVRDGGVGIDESEGGVVAGRTGRRLVLRDAAGERFWEGVVDGRQLIIRWGKTGSRPQASLKTYADEKSAQDELNRLEEEQEQKGFVP
jgi:predicted DNA-binding WGR domain protein